MHIHATQMNINAINPYSAAADRAVAAQRAADLRKKLLKNVANLEASSSPEEARMIGQWLEQGKAGPRTKTSTMPAPQVTNPLSDKVQSFGSTPGQRRQNQPERPAHYDGVSPHGRHRHHNPCLAHPA